MTELLFTGPASAERLLVLTHGAGSPMDSRFMMAFSLGLREVGIRVARFEFPYMQRRRIDGKRRPPDRMSVLVDTWRTVISLIVERGFQKEHLFIGGKSLGGRVASMVADEVMVAGLVCLGYPFHAPNRLEETRIKHLKMIKTPTLIVQGDRDSLGSYADVSQYSLSSSIRLHWLLDGDHSFTPRKISGRGEKENWFEGIMAVAEFVQNT